jgi:hypothetical protein
MSAELHLTSLAGMQLQGRQDRRRWILYGRETHKRAAYKRDTPSINAQNFGGHRPLKSEVIEPEARCCASGKREKLYGEEGEVSCRT